ncbi:hypothetical protein CTEN210_01180 [Chaetoceros tenuissimus]|uniref:Equilibrative nucleoside transporter n=1 Tax=Chaetoceros tenuissimus TaxID=426638 RepID=A0AAD3CH31_9STRA|nr:hypothetical protein CTEN210_01180 [Chaetoceros tenuissimus]
MTQQQDESTGSSHDDDPHFQSMTQQEIQQYDMSSTSLSEQDAAPLNESRTDETRDAAIQSPSKKDRLLVKLVFLILGIGFLLPWNAVVSAAAYFESRTCISSLQNSAVAQENDDDGSSTSSTKTSSNFMLWFGLIYSFTGVITLGLRILYQQQHTKSNTISNTAETEAKSRRVQKQIIIASLSLFLFVMLLTTALVLVPKLDPNFFQQVSLLSSAIFGIAGSFIGAGITSFANMFPPDIGITPFISGQAIGGIVISLLNFILFGVEQKGADSFWNEKCRNSSFLKFDASIYLKDDAGGCEAYNIDFGAFAYFSAGSFFLVVCLVLYTHLEKSDIAEYYRLESTRSDNIVVDGNDVTQDEEVSHAQQQDAETDSLREPLLESTLEITTSNVEDSKASVVWKLIASPTISIFLTFMVTLTIFPSWATKMMSVNECKHRGNRLENDLFIPGLIVIFNVFDFLGRTASGYIRIETMNANKVLKILAWMRFIFFPLCLLCQANGNRIVSTITLFLNDQWPILFMVLLAFTNGFVSTLSFIYAAIVMPKDDESQQIGSTILNFSLGLGCLFGSLTSFIYNYVGTGHW